MDIKKIAATATMTGALGLGALGFGAGFASADPVVPQPPIPVPVIPDVNVPDLDVDVPTVAFPEIDDYFGLPYAHIPPGQLKKLPRVHGLGNPFYG